MSESDSSSSRDEVRLAEQTPTVDNVPVPVPNADADADDESPHVEESLPLNALDNIPGDEGADIDLLAIQALLRQFESEFEFDAPHDGPTGAFDRIHRQFGHIRSHEERIPIRSGLLFVSLEDVGRHVPSGYKCFVEVSGVSTEIQPFAAPKDSNRIHVFGQVAEAVLFRSAVGESDSSEMVAFRIPQFYGDLRVKFTVQEKIGCGRRAFLGLQRRSTFAARTYVQSVFLSHIVNAQTRQGKLVEAEWAGVADSVSAIDAGPSARDVVSSRDNWGLPFSVKLDLSSDPSSDSDPGGVSAAEMQTPLIRVQMRYIDAASCVKLVEERRCCTGAPTGVAKYFGVNYSIQSPSPNSCWLVDATELQQLCIPFAGDMSSRRQMLCLALMECARLHILEQALQQRCRYAPRGADADADAGTHACTGGQYTAFELTLLNIGPRQVMSQSLCRLLLQRCGHWCFQGVKLHTRSPIHTAVQQNNVQCLMLILRFLNTYQQSVIGWEVAAARSGQSRSRSNSAADSEGDTRGAAMTARTQALERFTTMMNWRDEAGMTPVMLACCYRAKGAASTIADSVGAKGAVPLSEKAHRKEEKLRKQERKDSLLVLRLLVHFGGRLDAQHPQTRRSCLMLAVEHGNDHLVEWMVAQIHSAAELRAMYHLQQPVHSQTDSTSAAPTTAPVPAELRTEEDADGELAPVATPAPAPSLLSRCVDSIVHRAAALRTLFTVSQAERDRRRSIRLVQARNRDITHMQKLRCAPFALDEGGNDALLVAVAHRQLDIIRRLGVVGSTTGPLGRVSGGQLWNCFKMSVRNSSGEGVFHMVVGAKDLSVCRLLCEGYVANYTASLRLAHRYRMAARTRLCGRGGSKKAPMALSTESSGRSVEEATHDAATDDFVHDYRLNSWMHRRAEESALETRNCNGLTPCSLAQRYVAQVEAELTRLSEGAVDSHPVPLLASEPSQSSPLARCCKCPWSLDLSGMDTADVETELGLYKDILVCLTDASAEIAAVQQGFTIEEEAQERDIRVKAAKASIARNTTKTTPKTMNSTCRNPGVNKQAQSQSQSQSQVQSPAPHSLLKTVETAMNSVASLTKYRYFSSLWTESSGSGLGGSEPSQVGDAMVYETVPGGDNCSLEAGAVGTMMEECKANEADTGVCGTPSLLCTSAAALTENIDDEVDYAYALLSKPNTIEAYFVNRYGNVREL